MKRIRKAVIPAAGYGTRFLPLTKIVPKELLPVGNKPVIQYVVEEAVASGIEEIILICHPSKMDIVDYFRPDRELRAFLEKKGKGEEIAELERLESMARFEVVYQKEPLGLGHAVLCAREALGDEPFVVMLPDVFVASGVPAARCLIDTCEAGGAEWGILLERVSRSRVSAYGIIEGDRISDGVYQLRGAIEKPKPQEAPSDLGILGRYLFSPAIFDYLKAVRAGVLGEIQLTDAIDQMSKEACGHGIVYRGEMFDVGTPEGLREAYQYLEAIASYSPKKARNLKSL